ncbi:phosphonate C-P lyase system protein PhnH [Paracoccus sp. 11-3]|uniref:Phosphonate C-P lyase system protein PhnH n=1 Tax=Paracoccus amoyensis TaxID=2760093 RepID=A0A926J643_9RHOB|nr:phosphonate C-P lyase system protein PhnH [Paracoccus amoyensis]MBC9246892.1 phosphonate C-P lyase system protein PhnH [Paracoccus amoyensis]
MIADMLSGGFTDAPVQSARAFREILEAMARPGTIRRVEGALPPAPLSVAAGVTLLTLCDATTPLHLAGRCGAQAVKDWIAFHIGAPLFDAPDADFALGHWADLQPVNRFRIGQPDYPDRSATLIVERDVLSDDGPALTGPGIQLRTHLNLPEVQAFHANRALFPLGFDTIFTAGNQIACLPRSTRVEVI